MLEIQLQEVSKRFQYEWIFKNLSLTIPFGTACAVTGGNGSGKSTLLKCIAGAIPVSSGKINFLNEGKSVPESEWYSMLAISAPYLELPEEFTLLELIQFHFKFKAPLSGITPEELIQILYLDNHSHKQVSQFSSGMKQRVKLGLSIFSDVPLVLLDEPTSNLDKKGVSWYQDLIQNYQRNRTLIVCSNDPREYEFCSLRVSTEEYK